MGYLNLSHDFLVPDGSVSRTKSMPASPIPDAPALVSHEGVLPRSNTEKRRTKKNVDSASLRSTDAKLSDSKKVSLLACSLVFVLYRPVYCS